MEVEPNANAAVAPHTGTPYAAWARPGDFVLLGILLGVITGIVEFTLRWFIASVLQKPSYHDFGHDLLWMLPAANLILLGSAGLFIGLFRLHWKGDWLLRGTLAVFCAAAAYAMLLHFRGLHDVVRIILSLGIGVRAAEFLIRRSRGVEGVVRRLALPAAAAVVLTAFATRATVAIRERSALAALGPAAAQAPNVLVIVLDAVRSPDLSAYGYERRTSPELERLARRSVLFEMAIVTAPWSLTSHASMFTGRYPHEMTANWNVPLDATHPTLAEVLRGRGYATGAFVANSFYGRAVFGLDRGFIRYQSRKFSLGSIIVSAKLGNAPVRIFNRLTNSYYGPARMDAEDINTRLLSWLPSRGSHPFFIFVNYFDAHEPYAVPPPYNRLFSGTEPPTRRIREGTRKEKAELQGLRDAYDQSIAYVDARLGDLLRELERRQLLSNTVLVVTSDHGEEFGEHGWVSHGNGLHLPALRVPLVIFFPERIPGGTRVAEPVTLRDLPATVSDLLGLGSQAPFPGNSLTSRWTSATDSLNGPRSPVLSELGTPDGAPTWYAVAKGDMKSIIVGKYHYIRNGDGREELFDISADPWEANDLANTAEGRATIVALRAALDSATRAAKPVHKIP